MRNLTFLAKSVTVLTSIYLGIQPKLALAAFGNEFELKANERVVYEEEGYVEIQIDVDEDQDSSEQPDIQHVSANRNTGITTSDGHRLLYEKYDTAKSKSNRCKVLCLDENKIFCPTDNYGGGVCCHQGEFCPAGKNDYDDRFYQSVAWCSNYNEFAPMEFKYLVCPNENSCGDGGRKFIMPPLSGQTVTREIEKHDMGNLFLDEDVCSWVIRNPPGMGARDWMWVEITRVDRCDVFVTKAYQYKYRGRNPPKRAVNSKFGMLRGLDYYVVAIARSQFPAWLRLRTWIERHDPPPQKQNKVFEDEQQQNENTSNDQRVDEKSDNSNSGDNQDNQDNSFNWDQNGGQTDDQNSQDADKQEYEGNHIKLNSQYFNNDQRNLTGSQEPTSSNTETTQTKEPDNSNESVSPTVTKPTTMTVPEATQTVSTTSSSQESDLHVQDHRETLWQQEQQQAEKEGREPIDFTKREDPKMTYYDEQQQERAKQYDDFDKAKNDTSNSSQESTTTQQQEQNQSTSEPDQQSSDQSKVESQPGQDQQTNQTDQENSDQVTQKQNQSNDQQVTKDEEAVSQPNSNSEEQPKQSEQQQEIPDSSIDFKSLTAKQISDLKEILSASDSKNNTQTSNDSGNNSSEELKNQNNTTDDGAEINENDEENSVDSNEQQNKNSTSAILKVDQKPFSETFKDQGITVPQILIRDALNLEEAPTMLHIYFTLSVLGFICLCCCLVCCCWVCILKPKKVKKNQTAIALDDKESDFKIKEDMYNKLSARGVEVDRWTDDGRTDVESENTDRKLIKEKKQSMHVRHTHRTSILNKIAAITQIASKQGGSLEPEKEKELKTLMTYLESLPAEQEQASSPQWGFNQLATNSVIGAPSIDCGSSTTNTVIYNGGGIPMPNLQGTPLITKSVVDFNELTDRPRTHQIDLQADVFENDIQIADSGRIQKNTEPFHLHQKSEDHHREIRDIEDYFKQRDQDQNPNGFCPEPVNDQNQVRSSLNDRDSDILNSKTVKQGLQRVKNGSKPNSFLYQRESQLCRGSNIRRNDFGIHDATFGNGGDGEPIRVDVNSNTSNPSIDAEKDSCQQIASDGGPKQKKKKPQLCSKLEFEPSFKRLNSEMHNEEESEVKPEPDVDEQIKMLVVEQPSGMMSEKDPGNKSSQIDTYSASQLKEGGVKSSHVLRASHFTKAIAQQIPAHDSKDIPMPPLEMDSCEVIQEKPQLENDSYEICEVVEKNQNPPLEDDSCEQVPEDQLNQPDQNLNVSKEPQLLHQDLKKSKNLEELEVKNHIIDMQANDEIKCKEKDQNKKLNSLRVNNQMIDLQITEKPIRELTGQNLHQSRELSALRNDSGIYQIQIADEHLTMSKSVPISSKKADSIAKQASVDDLNTSANKVIDKEKNLQDDTKQMNKNLEPESLKEDLELAKLLKEKNELLQKMREQTNQIQTQNMNKFEQKPIPRAVVISNTNELEESHLSQMIFDPVNDSKVDEESWVNTGMFQLVNDAMNYTRTETVLDSSLTNSKANESNSQEENSETERSNSELKSQEQQAQQKKHVTFQEEQSESDVQDQSLSQSADERDSQIEVDSTYKKMAEIKGKNLSAKNDNNSPAVNDISLDVVEKELPKKNKSPIAKVYPELPKSQGSIINANVTNDFKKENQPAAKEEQWVEANELTIAQRRNQARYEEKIKNLKAKIQQSMAQKKPTVLNQPQIDSNQGQVQKLIKDKLQNNNDSREAVQPNNLGTNVEKSIGTKTICKYESSELKCANKAGDCHKSDEKNEEYEYYDEEEEVEVIEQLSNKVQENESQVQPQTQIVSDLIVKSKEEQNTKIDDKAIHNLPDIFGQKKYTEPNLVGFDEIDLQNDNKDKDDEHSSYNRPNKPNEKKEGNLIPQEVPKPIEDAFDLPDPNKMITDKQNGFYPSVTGMKWRQNCEDEHQTTFESRADPSVIFEGRKRSQSKAALGTTIDTDSRPPMVKDKSKKKKKKKQTKGQDVSMQAPRNKSRSKSRGQRDVFEPSRDFL